MNAQDAEKSLPTSLGNWLYVGGSGPGNYSTIQDAINASSDHDTIFVYDDSSPYNEAIEITKPLTIIGENQDTTIIDAQGIIIGDGIIVHVRADFVTLSCFTIQNGFYGIESPYYNNGTYTYNTLYNIEDPLSFSYSSNNTISHNRITIIKDYQFGFSGIYLYEANNNIVSDNIVHNTHWEKFDAGINVGYSHGNNITNNTLYNCSIQAWEHDFADNTFEGNTINGKPIVCLKNKSYYIIADAAQVALINCEHISITNIEFSRQHLAVIIANSKNCEISQCTFTDNYGGIRLVSSSNITATNNTIHNGLPKLLSLDFTIGMWLEATSASTISQNTIRENSVGLLMEESDNNIIEHNTIRNNRGILKFLLFGWTGGLYLAGGTNNRISSNNFIRNLPEACFFDKPNTWIHNYWGRPWILPRPIIGFTYGGPMEPLVLTFDFDLRPALVPQ